MKKVVEFYKTKNHYEILDESALMKDLNSGDWVEAVIYREYKELICEEYVEITDRPKQTFVREKRDFNKKFSLCLDL